MLLARLDAVVVRRSVLKVAGRRWHWEAEALLEFASALDDLGFDVGEAELGAIAEWVGRGLTAYP